MYLEIISDSTINRTLRTAAFTDVNNMTIESCIAFCTPNGYQYAGLEFSRVGTLISYNVNLTAFSVSLSNRNAVCSWSSFDWIYLVRSEEHTSELQSLV